MAAALKAPGVGKLRAGLPTAACVTSGLLGAALAWELGAVRSK